MRVLRVRFTLRTLMAVVGVVALLIVGAQAALRPPQPSAVIAGTTFRFGAMPPETSGQHVWPIANAGRVPLQVYLVCSGFNCKIRGIINGRNAIGNGNSLMIPPGGKADIVMAWRTHRGNRPYKGYVQLGTNDPGVPIIVLTVEGLIERLPCVD
jgi:hypothetical protein